MGAERKAPGAHVARWIHAGTTVLLPGARPFTHDAFKAVDEPYEYNGEWWVAVVAPGDDEPFAIALHEASLPI